VSADSALGVLSAGAGGPAVVAALRGALPREDLLVLSDAAYAPYARRSAHVVADRVSRLAIELQGAGVKAIALASAAATSDALEAVTARVGVPVLGLEPVLPARLRGPVAFVVGAGSLRGMPLARTLRASRGVTVVVDAWPGLDTAEAARQVPARVAALRERGVTALVLADEQACAVRQAVEAAAGDLPVHDAAETLARRLQALLRARGLLARRRRAGRLQLMSSHPTRDAWFGR
jgi:glutamate racemase